VAGATSGGGSRATPSTKGGGCRVRFFFFKRKKINFNIFLLITVDGILVFKSNLTVKNGIFHPN
jgi:hypothetical protein